MPSTCPATEVRHRDEAIERRCFHDVPHFYASGLIKANLNPKVVQARLGHATTAETMDAYGHLFPGDEDLGRGAIETLLASASAKQRRNTGG